MKRKRERRWMSKPLGKSRPEAARRPKLQVLEDRCVLSITPPVLLAAQGTLVITGGSLDDTVVVSESPDDASIIVQQYELGVRLTTTYPKSSITSLQFFGNDGNDRLTNRTDIATYAEGGEGNDSLTGGRGSDTLSGGNGKDRLEGGFGNDTLDGGSDEDVLHGEEGADRLNGGDGKDLLYGGEGSDRLYGDAGDDQLEGSTGEDYLNGGTGNDRLSGGGGDDFLNGADGADRLLGQQGDDILLGGDGDDVLLGEAGNDNLHGGEGDDYLYGADGNDRLYGNAGVDRLDGDGGDDYLNGGSGNDLLDGGADKDFLNGADGDDRLIGGGDADAMLGGAGIDTLFGGEGADRLDGGADDDLLYGGEGPDLLYGRSGDDRLEGEAGDDYLNGGSDNDAILGGIGNDFLAGDTGEDRLEGDDGDDTLHGGDGPDVLLGDEGDDHLEGGSGDDVLHGAGGADIAYGGSGNDWLDGGSGNDALYGDSGDDYLQGGSDADYLFGDSGDDRLSGQGGDDTLLAGDGNDVLLGDDGDDHLEGGNGDDYLYGNEGNDFANGDAGHDTVYGEAGNDFLRGGEGDDLLVGGAGSDHLLGDDGSDRLEGDDGPDVLLGGDGADSLVAGLGNDIAIGGDGVDTVLGSEGDDILIGGKTAYDADPAALSEALAQWNAGLAYEERVGALSSHTASAKFVPHMTVHADLASDLLEGGSGQDWFILSAINGVYSPLGMSHGADGHALHHGSTIFLDEKPALEGFALIDSIDRLNNSLPSEAVHTALPHGDNASKLGEHLRLFQLVRYADVTHTAIGSGNWSDPSVWENGRVPTESSRVLIPHGAAVVVDSRLEDDLHSIRVDGSLSFATDRDTELRVDTVVVTTTGSLQMGTAEAPVQQGVSAKLLITDTGPIDRVADPFGLGRGLITHGTVRMHGAATTSFVAMTGAVQAGATTLRLASVPIGWNVGDKIAIAGTTVGGEQDETRVIRAISGDTVTFDPLDYDHAPFEPGLEVHVANLTRNVMVESETTSDIRRGHVMFMHNRDVHVSYAAFNELGRTDKEFNLTDPEVDENWNLIGESGNNPRARYSVHFHRNGVQANSAPATVHGSVVDGGPGWGFVNHSSYVDFTENVAFGVDGAAFVAEAGDEIGRFDSNLALHTTGTAGDLDSRFNQQDFGFSGEGFWLQSPGVTVTNNVVAGSAGSAYIYYSRGLGHGESQVQFLAENLDDPSIAGGDETISVIATPITKFEGNVAYASQVGLTSRYNLRNAEHPVQSVFSDSTFWNNQVGVDLPYANQTVLRDLTVLADPAAGLLNGIDHNALTRNITYENLRVEGYQRAILLPRQGTNVVDGGQFKSFNSSLVVYPADVNGLEVLIKGDPIFASLGDSIAKDVTMKFQTDNASNNPRHVFRDVQVRLQYGVFSDHRLYFREQEASAIPFPEPLAGIPDSYVGLTQAQLSAQFDVRVGGEIAPDLAVPVPTLHGLVAPISLSALRQA